MIWSIQVLPVRFFSYLLLTISNRKHLPNAPLAAAIQPMRDLGACGDETTGHNTGISLLLSTSAWVLLSPPIERRETRPTV